MKTFIQFQARAAKDAAKLFAQLGDLQTAWRCYGHADGLVRHRRSKKTAPVGEAAVAYTAGYAEGVAERQRLAIEGWLAQGAPA